MNDEIKASSLLSFRISSRICHNYRNFRPLFRAINRNSLYLSKKLS